MTIARKQSEEALLMEQNRNHGDRDREGTKNQDRATSGGMEHVSVSDVSANGENTAEQNQRKRRHQLVSFVANVAGCAIVCGLASPLAVVFSVGVVVSAVLTAHFANRSAHHLDHFARSGVVTCLVALACYMEVRATSGLSDHAMLAALVQGGDVPVNLWLAAALALVASFQTAASASATMKMWFRRAAQ